MADSETESSSKACSEFVDNASAKSADFVEFVRTLDRRERAVLERRLCQKAPETLEKLGLEFGITRERIRQIEKDLVKRINTCVSLMSKTQLPREPLLSGQNGILIKDPRLDESYNDVSVLDLLFASGFAKRLVSREGITNWVVVGEHFMPTTDLVFNDISDLVTHAKSERISTESFTQAMHSLHLSSDEIVDFMSDFELEFGREFVRSKPRNLADMLLATLKDYDRALSEAEITVALSDRWTWGSARNLMSSDARFMTVDISTYALSEWGLREYRGIKEEVISLIEDSGPMPLVEVTEIISEWFPSVSELSIRTYSNSLPLQVLDGVVSLSDEGVSIRHSLNEMTPRQLRGFFRCEGGFKIRIEVNEDHLRGSGFPCSRVIGAILGIKIGDSWSCPIEGYPISLNIYNRSTQAAFGTIRNILEALNAECGDQLFFKLLGAEGKITAVTATLLRKKEVSTSPTEMVCQYIGISGSTADVLDSAARHLGLPISANWSDIESTAAARGDALLERAARLVSIQLNQSVQ